MFRKILVATGALALIGTVAFTTNLVPTASAAVFNHERHEWRPAVRFHGPSYASCYVRRVTHTPFGPRVHWVNICF